MDRIPVDPRWVIVEAFRKYGASVSVAEIHYYDARSDHKPQFIVTLHEEPTRSKDGSQYRLAVDQIPTFVKSDPIAGLKDAYRHQDVSTEEKNG